MARKHRDEGGGDTWLNTYADMVTLLLTFFAVLLSMSSVNEEKFMAFIRSFVTSTPASSMVAMLGDSDFGNTLDGEEVTDENAMNELYKKLKNYVDQTEQGDAIEVFGGEDVVYIRFNSAAFFEPDSYVLRPGGKEIVSYVGDALKAYEPEIKYINICGHTADPPGASAQGVWMLSGERAAVVATYFEDEKKIESSKMIILGYGKNYPISDNETSKGMEKNRRVELVVVGNRSALDTDVFGQYATLYDAEKYPAEGGTEDVLDTPNSGETDISNFTAGGNAANSAANSSQGAAESQPAASGAPQSAAAAPAQSNTQ